jgi:hypothetical protein
MEAQGYLVDIVERWIPGANIRKDLFGFGDLVCIREGETMLVQTTSYSNVSARVKKITEHENLAAVRKAGWGVLVQGWHKVGNRWQVREVDLS